MPCPPHRIGVLAAACLIATVPAIPMAYGQPDTPPEAPSKPDIFDPNRAPEIVLHIGGRRITLTHQAGDSTTLTANAIEKKANSSNFSNIIASSVPGAAQSSSGELHIRGSHGQYTYYLDGAPLPSSISGSFSDLIDPKNIETLHVYTGGFPARYGGNLAAVFDVTAKAGQTKRPGTQLEQIVQGYGTSQSTGQIGQSIGDTSYFISGVRGSTDRRLDPVTQDPLHDSGTDSVAFLKVDHHLISGDRLTLDAARTDGEFQIPNEPDREALGQNDIQRENGSFANLIWRRSNAKGDFTAAFYSHQSRLRYDGSPADLTGATPDNPLISTFEDRTAQTTGLRLDAVKPISKQHKLGYGFDISTVKGSEDFRIVSSDGVSPNQVVVDNHPISGGDKAAYLEDAWTPAGGRWHITAGARYDIHNTDETSSQLSPRVNAIYSAGPYDKLHIYYNRLFQPASIEDVRRLSGSTAIGEAVLTAIKPERNNFYEVGWQRDRSGRSIGLNAYYKTAKDVIDESPLGNTQITVPFNVEKGYVRGIELALSGPLARNATYYANYARSWAQSAGAITGGIFSSDPPTGYFPVDHDQTHTASLGIDYEHNGTDFSMDGEYGSGFPFFENGEFHRVEPHFIVNTAIGTKIGDGNLAFTVINLLNHPYVIKQAGQFTDREWGQARTFGVKYTVHF